jgi:hypothetical protein
MGPSWVWNKLLNACFRVQDFLRRNFKATAIIVVVGIVGLLLYFPVVFGAAIIGILIIILIGTFNVHERKKSLIDLCVFLLLFGVILSPIITLAVREKYRMDNPSQLINREHPKIQEMTAEFRGMIGENETTKAVLNRLEDYVYARIPYSSSFSFFPFSPLFPTTDEVMAKMTSNCRGRALAGYCILKNMGYDVQVAAGEGHAWLRVHENGSYLETFLAGRYREPWLIFNEAETRWVYSTTDELYEIFFESFRVNDYMDFAIITIIFGVPVGAGAIHILISKRNRRFRVYLAAIGGALAVAIAIGLLGILIGGLMWLPIAVAGGLYLRVLNQKIKLKSFRKRVKNNLKKVLRCLPILMVGGGMMLTLVGIQHIGTFRMIPGEIAYSQTFILEPGSSHKVPVGSYVFYFVNFTADGEVVFQPNLWDNVRASELKMELYTMLENEVYFFNPDNVAARNVSLTIYQAGYKIEQTLSFTLLAYLGLILVTVGAVLGIASIFRKIHLQMLLAFVLIWGGIMAIYGWGRYLTFSSTKEMFIGYKISPMIFVGLALIVAGVVLILVLALKIFTVCTYSPAPQSEKVKTT